MEQTPITAILSGLFALLTAVLTGIVTITVARHRGEVTERLARLKSQLDGAAADRRATVDAELAQLKARFDKELSALGESSQTRLKIAEGRLPAYRSLWKCMSPVSMTLKAELTPKTRSELDAALRTAFFEEGGGLLLSHEALGRYVTAIEKLRDGNTEDSEVREAFSAFREQMKADLSIYTNDQARTPIRSSAE